MNLMDVGEFDVRRLYTGLWLDYRLKLLWAPTSASWVISAVAELVFLCCSSVHTCVWIPEVFEHDIL